MGYQILYRPKTTTKLTKRTSKLWVTGITTEVKCREGSKRTINELKWAIVLRELIKPLALLNDVVKRENCGYRSNKR